MYTFSMTPSLCQFPNKRTICLFTFIAAIETEREREREQERVEKKHRWQKLGTLISISINQISGTFVYVCYVACFSFFSLFASHHQNMSNSAFCQILVWRAQGHIKTVACNKKQWNKQDRKTILNEKYSIWWRNNAVKKGNGFQRKMEKIHRKFDNHRLFFFFGREKYLFANSIVCWMRAIKCIARENWNMNFTHVIERENKKLAMLSENSARNI